MQSLLSKAGLTGVSRKWHSYFLLVCGPMAGLRPRVTSEERLRIKVFYHDRCFDGASSAALFSRF